MSEIRRRYDPEFKSGAVRIVLETRKPIARVARDLGLHPGTLGNWVKQQRVSQEGSGPLGEDSLAELVRLRKEVAELRMERHQRPPVELALLEEELMSEIRRRYDPEFKSGAVRIVLETRKPIARVARDLGLHPGTLGNWVKQQRVSQEGSGPLGEDSLAELVRLRKEVAELRMERDVLKRSVVLWVKEATR